MYEILNFYTGTTSTLARTILNSATASIVLECRKAWKQRQYEGEDREAKGRRGERCGGERRGG